MKPQFATLLNWIKELPFHLIVLFVTATVMVHVVKLFWIWLKFNWNLW